MPRNSSGIYSLPELPFVPGTTIQSEPVNSDLSDIASALTQSLATTGVSSMTGPLKLANGSVTEPSLTFSNSQGTGFFRVSDNVTGFTVNGTLGFTINSDLAIDFEGSIGLGNIDDVEPDRLDWYEEGTFTPVLEFGGASVGIAYAVRTGSFTRIGDMVFFDITIELSNKGSSVGDAKVTGLPYDALVGAICVFGDLGNFIAATGNGAIWGFIEDSDNSVFLLGADGTGGSASFKNTDFNNNTSFMLTGHYKTG